MDTVAASWLGDRLASFSARITFLSPNILSSSQHLVYTIFGHHSPPAQAGRPTTTPARRTGGALPLSSLSHFRPLSRPTMLSPLSSSSSSPAVHILVHWLFPLTGSLLGFIMSIAPLRAVRRAEKAGELGALNPLPSCVFLLNCTAWLLYGAAVKDPFVFCAVRG